MDKTFLIDKLVTNALSRNQTVVGASYNALKIFSHKDPNLIIEYIDNSIRNVQQITTNLLDLYCFLFSEVSKELKQNEKEESTDQQKNELKLKVFVSLQFYYIKSKNIENFQPWEKLCSEYISSVEISKKLYPLVINQSNLYSTCSFITLFYCANFVADDILNALDSSMIKKPMISDKMGTLININPTYFVRLLFRLSEKQKENELKVSNQDENNVNEATDSNINPVSLFISFQFRYILQYFLEHPNDENVINCIVTLFDRIYPQACPAHLRYYVTRICTDLSSLNNDQGSSLATNHIIMVENMLIKFCSIPDSEIWKKTVDFILKHMHLAYVIEVQKQNQKSAQQIHLSHFPINANENDPSFSSSAVFTSSLDNIIKLCFDSQKVSNNEFDMNPLDIVLSSLLAAIDTQRAAISYKTLSSLLNASNSSSKQIKFSNEQMIMIISSITAVASRNIAEPSLCSLALDILKLPSSQISETDSELLTKYIVNSSISMNNSHYLLQVVSVNKEFFINIFNLITESLFDEGEIALLPSLVHVIHLFLLILTKSEENVNENDSEESLQQPLVPIFLKKSILEKSLLLLRLLSCLMSLGAMHPFVPSMISILSVFFDITFPLAFDEIKSILEAVTKRINALQPQLSNINNDDSNNKNNTNRLSEFGSIIMSLLSNIMKLINDSQFRLSLCSAVIHDVEMNSYSLHSQNCLWIFDTIVPFLPVEVASANIEKLFKIIPFYPSSVYNNSSQGNSASVTASSESTSAASISSTLAAFADILGSISGRNYKLINPFIKKWKEMKSNNNFLVGKKPQPIPYSFIAMTLTSVSRDVEVPILLEIANSELFPLLIQLMKRKQTELNPGYCLNALIELCKRLTFHKVPKNFVLLPNNSPSNNVFIFKYILNVFSTHKQKPMFKPCLAAFRYFIQVPPCLTAEQRTIIKDKIIVPSFIMFTVNEINNNGDKQLFLELRGLLFAMICTSPETTTILTLLVSLMPNCQNKEVLSLIWRLLSLFDSRREKTKPTTDNNAENTTVQSASYSNLINEEKYNLIKFYKQVQIGKISILPQIIADLLSTVYNRKKNDDDNFIDLALQSIYLLFRIDRNVTDEVTNDSENLSSSFDDVSSISHVSDLSGLVLNKLAQSEIDNLLNYSIDKMRKIKNLSANYSFVISQVLKYVSPHSKLALLDSHKEQLCIDAITCLNTETVSPNISLAKMQSLITEFVSSSMVNLLDFYETNLPESKDFLFSFPSPDFVQQLLLKYPEVFVKKLVQNGFNESTRKILLKTFEDESGQCVEILLQQLCLFLLEMPDDDKNSSLSGALLFISFIIITINNNDSKPKKKFSFEIPIIHIYQTICSLLIFGFSMNIFLNVKDTYTTEFQNKLKNSVALSSAASSPIMNNNSNDKSQKQQQQRHLFIKVLSLYLSKVPRKTIETDENGKLTILPLDANKAFTIVISALIEGPNILLLIDVMNFLMSACQLSKPRVSSGITALCGEILYHYKDLFLEKNEQSNILNLYFPTLLSFVVNFGEFTCIVALNEISKFMNRNDIINKDVNNGELPVHYISRILQVIMKRCSSSNSSNSSSLILANDVFIAAISCVKQFCKSFYSKLDDEMHSVLFNIFIELLKICGKRYNDQIAVILFDLVNNLSNDQELSEQLVKYVVIYEIITYKKANENKVTTIQINDNSDVKEIKKIDIQKEENVVVSVFGIFLDSSVPLLISSALNLMKENSYNCIVNHFVDKIINLIGHSDDNVATSATTIVELLPSYFV